MKEFVVLDECRSLLVKVNPIDKMVTMQEQLDEEVQVVSITFDEAYKTFNAILDSINKDITAVS